jgi:hypothetical protein
MIAFFAMLAIYGIRSELPIGSPMDRALRVVTFATPIILIVAAYMIPSIKAAWNEKAKRLEHQQYQEELESRRRDEMVRTERLARIKAENEKEEKELRRQQAAEVRQREELEEVERALAEESKQQEKRERDWLLKSSKLECERQFELFRPLIRKDFNESRFQRLLNSHLGNDCPTDQIACKKNEVLQLLTLLVGETMEGEEQRKLYHDAPSAIQHFQREIDRIKEMAIEDDDKEMLVALMRKRRVVVLDRLVNDAADSP